VGIFKQIPIAGFAGTQGGSGFPFLRDINAGGNHIFRLLLVIREQGIHPADQPSFPGAGQPVVFLHPDCRSLQNSRKALPQVGLLFRRHQNFPKGLRIHLRQGVPAQGFTKAIPAHDPPIPIQRQDQGLGGLENRFGKTGFLTRRLLWRSDGLEFAAPPPAPLPAELRYC
jgi:hypothetical protein